MMVPSSFLGLMKCTLFLSLQMLLASNPFVVGQDGGDPVVAEMESLRRQVMELRNENQVLNQHINDWRSRSAELENGWRAAQAGQEQSQASVANLERQVQELNEKLTASNARIEQITREKDQAAAELTSSIARLEEITRAMDQATADLNAKNLHVEDITRAKDEAVKRIQQVEAEMSGVRNELTARVEEASKAKENALKEAEDKHRSLTATIESLHKELQATTEKHQATTALHEEKATALVDTEVRLERAHTRMQELTNAKDAAVKDLQQTQKSLQSAKDTLFQVRRELTATKQQVADLEKQANFWTNLLLHTRDEIVEFFERLPFAEQLKPVFYQLESGFHSAVSFGGSMLKEVQVAMPVLWKNMGGEKLVKFWKKRKPSDPEQRLLVVPYMKVHKELVKAVKSSAESALAYATIEKAPAFVIGTLSTVVNHTNGVVIYAELLWCLLLVVCIATLVLSLSPPRKPRKKHSKVKRD